MAAYSNYLDDVYGIKASATYTELTLLKKDEEANPAAEAEFTMRNINDDISMNTHRKEAIMLADIFKPEGEGQVNFVLAEGVPGAGKSMMALELCRRRHEIKATKDFLAVVLLRLCEERVQAAKSVVDLLYHDDPENEQAVAKELRSNRGSGLLLVLDGFDGVPALIRKESFLAKVISGHYLPKATILVTTRPSARADLLALRKPDKHIEVVGFTHKQIKQYAGCILGVGSPLLADLLMYVSSNPSVKSILYLPLNCAMVVEIYAANRKVGRPIPLTMTQLYSEVTLARIRRHVDEGSGQSESVPLELEDLPKECPKIYEQLLSLAKLAFEGKLERKVAFEKLPADCSTLGLMTASQQFLISRKSSFTFFHLAMQEFLSAYYISQLSDSEQKEVFHHHSTEFDGMDVVWKFVAGLTGFRHIGWDLVQSRRKLDIFGSRAQSKQPSVSRFLVECLYEAQGKADCASVLGSDEVNIQTVTGSKFTSFALGYCVAISKHTWEIEVTGGYNHEALEMLTAGLKSTREVSGLISSLKLCKVPIGHKGIDQLKAMPHQILCNLSGLDLRNCQLDGPALDLLADAIPTMTSLKHLSIGYNPVDYGETETVLQALVSCAHLESLNIAGLPIGSSDIMALSCLIRPSRSLKVLKIGSIKKAATVQVLLKAVLALIVGDVHVQQNDDHMERLLETTLSPSSLETLKLSGINLASLSLALPKENRNITALEIENGTIGTNNIFTIAEALHVNTTLENHKFAYPIIEADPSTLESSHVTDAISEFAGALRLNRSLKHVFVKILNADKSSAVGSEEARALIDAIRDNQTLVSLKLPTNCGNHFSREELAELDSRVQIGRKKGCVIQ